MADGKDETPVGLRVSEREEPGGIRPPRLKCTQQLLLIHNPFSANDEWSVRTTLGQPPCGSKPVRAAWKELGTSTSDPDLHRLPFPLGAQDPKETDQ
ncbi:hypothetical protein GCM10022215_37980 [Nocardioides fonticola]|uniref:Uncharacterized protein n=1 Tax=Nocardioides fonticola TaxID=450363 RepID=A0ABP7XXB9_9ACTN